VLENDLVAAKLHSPRILNLNTDSRFNAGSAQVAATSTELSATREVIVGPDLQGACIPTLHQPDVLMPTFRWQRKGRTLESGL
jgi:hypothetical protein